MIEVTKLINDGAEVSIPDKFLKLGLFSEYAGRLHPITPSGQMWSEMSKTEQDSWEDTVKLLEKDPEDYLKHMRRMLPANPKGVE